MHADDLTEFKMSDGTSRRLRLMMGRGRSGNRQREHRSLPCN